MTRTPHHTKIYTGPYYLSCLIFGLMVSWGESLLIWTPLPFTASMGEIISLNIFSILIGVFTGLMVAFIGARICGWMGKREEFSREVHQTSWAFALAVALFGTIMTIGGILGGSNLTRLFLVLILAPLAFILTYQFSVSFLFKKRLAGRITFEIFMVIFLIIYLVKHPNPSKEVPLTNPLYPHIFLFHIPNLDFGAEGRTVIAECIPKGNRDGLSDFSWAFAPISDKKANAREFFRSDWEKGENILSLLKDYDYHLGLFSVQRIPEELNFKAYDVVDNQTFSLKSRHSLFSFYNKILPVLKMNELASRFDGYPAMNKRNPAQLNERLLNMIKRKRDENPFFIFSSYAPVPHSSGALKTPGEAALQSLLSSLNKMGMLESSLIFFTSFTGADLHKPLFIYSGKSFFSETISDFPVSQADITATISSNFLKVEQNNEYTIDLRKVINGEALECRPIYAWENHIDPDSPAIMVCAYPWKLEREGENSYRLTNIADDPEGKINLTGKEPGVFQILSAMLKNPTPSAPETLFNLKNSPQRH